MSWGLLLVAWASAQNPNAFWGARTSIAVNSCTSIQSALVKTETRDACNRLRRALYLVDNYQEELNAEFANSIWLKVYFQNRAFYDTRLRRRVKACDQHRIDYKCVGLCATASERVAYVLTTLGFVHSTINLCDEHFQSSPPFRLTTLIHEFGRLEGIGDSGAWDTDDIHVWDGIFSTLGDPSTYQHLVRP